MHFDKCNSCVTTSTINSQKHSDIFKTFWGPFWSQPIPQPQALETTDLTPVIDLPFSKWHTSGITQHVAINTNNLFTLECF